MIAARERKEKMGLPQNPVSRRKQEKAGGLDGSSGRMARVARRCEQSRPFPG